MKKTLNLLIALALAAGLCLPVLAQDEAAAPPAEETAAPKEKAPEKKPAKKPAKKKAKKKKKAPPQSEYKFDAVEKTETYKFDRKANPIVKKKPAKKKAAKKGEKTKGENAPEKAKDPKSLDEKSVKFDPEKGGE